MLNKLSKCFLCGGIDFEQAERYVSSSVKFTPTLREIPRTCATVAEQKAGVCSVNPLKEVLHTPTVV